MRFRNKRDLFLKINMANPGMSSTELSNFLNTRHNYKFSDQDSLSSSRLMDSSRIPYIQTARDNTSSYALIQSEAFDKLSHTDCIEIPAPEDTLTSNLHGLATNSFESTTLFRRLDQTRELIEDFKEIGASYPQPNPKSASNISIGIQCSVQLGASNMQDGPLWNKLNHMLAERGFKVIPVSHDENCNAYPDMDTLSTTLIDILNELDKKTTKLRNKLRDLSGTDRLRQELLRHKKEKEEYERTIQDLQKELQTEKFREKENLKSAESQMKEVEKHNRMLQQKLKSVNDACKHRETQIQEMKEQLDIKLPNVNDVLKNIGPEKEKSIFRKFFNREYRHTSEQDCKVMALIMAYEEQKSNLVIEIERRKETGAESFSSNSSTQPSSDELDKQLKEHAEMLNKLNREKLLIENQKKELQEEIFALRHELKERPTIKEFKSLKESLKKYESPSSAQLPDTTFTNLSGEECRRVLLQLSESLQSRTPSALQSSISKLQQVVMATPQLERFIQNICMEIHPNKETWNSSPKKLDEILPTIRKWKRQLEDHHSILNLKSYICTLFNIDPKKEVSPEELMSILGTSFEAINYFKSMYEITDNSEIVPTMNQVFVFVHEIKGFLQTCRKSLGLDPKAPVPMVLYRLSMLLRNN
jgi:predicted  nucleic acid-binding Zn-ribbon protein